MVSMNMNIATVHEQRHLCMDSATGMNGALRLQTQDMPQGKRRPEVASYRPASKQLLHGCFIRFCAAPSGQMGLTAYRLCCV